MGENLRHIAIFIPYEGVEVEHLLGLLRRLSDNFPVLIEHAEEVSLDSRRGVRVVQNWLVPDHNSLLEFKATPIHIEVGEQLSKIADWVTADYIERSDV
jgi:hypothetical protein